MDKMESKPIPTNEEVIDEVTKDLESSLITKPPDDLNAEKTPQAVTPQDSQTEEKSSNLKKDEDKNFVPSDFEDESAEGKSNDEPDFDDTIDEVALKDLEVTYTEEDRMHLCSEAKELKEKGNDQFKAGQFRDSAITYTKALRLCPLHFESDRAVLYHNRAAAKSKIGLSKSAIEDCSKAVELNEKYLKAYVRRAQLYRETEKLDEALEDYKKILEIDPHHAEARAAAATLPQQIQERNDKLKTEMMSKLKDVGNLLLRPFGLSTDDFQLNQDPNTGGYSISMGKR